MKHTTGWSRMDVIAITVILIALIGCGSALEQGEPDPNGSAGDELAHLLKPSLAKARATAIATQDQAQIRGVMAGTLQSSADFNDKFISPDLIARKPHAQLGEYMWGKGDRVIDWNSTESLCSALIMRMYLEPSAFISPVDPNPYIGAKGEVEESDGIPVPYDYDCWDPANATRFVTSSPHGFWDTAFYCDLKPKPNSWENSDHNSYANSTLCGNRLKKWNANQGHDRITWSTRGSEMGATAGDYLYDDSPALKMLGEDTVLISHMAHADGSVTRETNFKPVQHYSVTHRRPMEDNVFDAEFCQEYFEPNSGQAQCWGAADNFLTYSTTTNTSGGLRPLFPGGQAVDVYAQHGCSWDTDGDW